MNILDLKITFKCLRNSLSLLVGSSSLTGHYDWTRFIKIFNFLDWVQTKSFSQTFNLVYKNAETSQDSKNGIWGRWTDLKKVEKN